MVFGSFDYDRTFLGLKYLIIPISPHFSLFPMHFHLEGYMYGNAYFSIFLIKYCCLTYWN
jgi:hypothetical protein